MKKTPKSPYDRAEEQQSKPRFSSAYYPHFHHEEKAAPIIPRVTDTVSDTRPTLEYAFELCCNSNDFSNLTSWKFFLGKAGVEKELNNWQQTPTKNGFSLIQQTEEATPRTLFSRSFLQQTPLSVRNVTAKPAGTKQLDEAFLAVIPAVQFGDRLGQATEGYYYHFHNDQLLQEFKILGDGKPVFQATRSDANGLSSELLSEGLQNAIPLYWRKEGEVVSGQYLLYRANKLTASQLNEIDTAWLEQHGLAMEVDALIKTGHGEQTSEERYHAPLTVGYRHPGRLLHGSNIVAFNNPRLLVKGVPVVNLRPEKIFRIGVFFDGTGNNDKNDAYKERDTVASFYKAGNSDEGNFQMGLEPTCATTVFQLAATHEYRVNFPRTSLEKAGWKPDNFFEEHFPGAHSDVGGGYPSYKQYDKTGLPERLGFPIESTYNRELIKKELCGDFSDSSYLARKQLTPDDIPAERKRWQLYCFQRYRQHGEVKLKGSRLYYYRLQPVSNATAGLSLERMKQQGQAAGIQWNEKAYQKNITPDYAENTACQALWAKLSTLPAGGITQASWEKELEPEQYRLVHRSHDTALSPGYDTFMERSINDVTRDAQGNPERRIWNNE